PLVGREVAIRLGLLKERRDIVLITGCSQSCPPQLQIEIDWRRLPGRPVTRPGLLQEIDSFVVPPIVLLALASKVKNPGSFQSCACWASGIRCDARPRVWSS